IGDDEAHQALGRRAIRALAGGRLALLAKQRPGGFEISAGLLERALAVHHPRAGLVAELLDERGADRDAHSVSPPSATAAVAGSGSRSGSSAASARSPSPPRSS